MPTPYKIFLSYSHDDSVLLDKFRQHLTTLQRNEKIELWYDREMIPGDNLDHEISTKLEDADIAMFLVSSSFLASYYCYDVELKKIIDRKENSEVRVIPVILHHCDWLESKLGDYLGVPSNGDPISSFDDPNLAFLSCVNELKRVISKLDEIEETKKKEITKPKGISIIKDLYSQDLEDTEIVFLHRNVDSIKLSDIYVYPDLRVFKTDEETIEVIAHSKATVLCKPIEKKVVLIMGGEQSGKTSLAKITFQDNYKNGLRPILINCAHIPTSLDINKLIDNSFDDQYESSESTYFSEVDGSNILILDDFVSIKFNAKYKAKFLKEVCEKFDSVLVFCHSDIRYDEVTFKLFENFERYEILRFGYVKREEIINKWNSLGIEETIESCDLEAINDRTKVQVDSIIRRNIVPSKPVFILTILQTLESARPSDHRLTSHGYCYQFLIQQALKKAKIPTDEFGSYINYLTEFANFIYANGRSYIDETQIKEFQGMYTKSYLVVRSHEQITQTLIDASILRLQNGFYYFAYKYVFYFYVAKHVSENLTSSNSKEIVSALCQKIHNEKHANILIFITHHTKSQEVIDEILTHASIIFEQYEPSKMASSDFQHVMEKLEKIPELILEQRNVDEERKKGLAKQDLREQPVTDIEEGIIEHDTEDAEIEDAESNAFLSEINRSAKAVEVIGQILRNRYGDLKIPQLVDLAEASFNTGLRFLSFYLEIHSKTEEETVSLIKKLIKKNSKTSDEQIENSARNLYVQLCYETTFSVIKKIALSNGSEKLLPVFDEVSNGSENSAALKLINLAIKLEFTNNIPFKLIESLSSELETNYIAIRMLKQIVIHHLYLHHVEVRDRQRIADILKLPIKAQRQIQNQKEMKTD
jgi:hypothetical protein